jgi:hypothetical protein
VLQTVLLWGLNPRHWLQAFLPVCADHGGHPPPDLSEFLPWTMSAERTPQLRQPWSVPLPPFGGERPHLDTPQGLATSEPGAGTVLPNPAERHTHWVFSGPSEAWVSLSAPPGIGHPAFPLFSIAFAWQARAQLAYDGYGFAEYLPLGCGKVPWDGRSADGDADLRPRGAA